MPTATIDIPYNLTPDQLHLEPSSQHHDYTVEDEWDMLGEMEQEEMPRILTAAVILYDHLRPLNIPFAMCLHTAFIWERG